VPLSGCEGNTFFDDASCQKSWAVDGVELCVTHLTLYLIIISFVQAHHSSSPAILSVRAVNKYALSVYRVLAEFMFRLTRSQAVARIADRTASQHLMEITRRHRSRHIPYAIAHLVVLSNQASISNSFRDIQRQM